MSSRRCDVLVVGAGPAGSAAAALFAHRGFHVRVLERAVFPRFKPCGDFLSPECTRILRRLGVEEAVRSAGARRLRGLLVSAYGQPILRADFEPGEQPFGYALERQRLDTILLSAARAAGAEVLEGNTVEGFAAPGAIRARSSGGKTGVFDARLIIGAGGKRCPIARHSGLQRRPPGEGRVDLLSHWRAVDAERPYCEMHVAAPGYTGVAASSPGVVNVNTVVPRSWLRTRIRQRNGRPESRAELEPSRPTPRQLPGSEAPQPRPAGSDAFRLEVYEKLLWATPAVRRLIDTGRPLYAPVASDVTPISTVRASADGILLAGDAALFIDPFTGQGIYLALRSAELAFEVGTAALESAGPSARRLADYDRLRAREFAPKVRLSRLLQAILYRPSLARRTAAALRRDPRSAIRLAAVIGDCRPAADLLSPALLGRLALAGIG